MEHEPIKESQSFYTSDLINPLKHFYKNPTDDAFIFQNYVLDVYQQRMEILETVHNPSKVIVIDCGLNACQIFTTVNKHQYIKFGFLYLTKKYLQLKSEFFPGKLYATSGVFYLNFDHSEVKKHIAFHNHSGEAQISFDYLILLD